jgi:hemerythrin-like domain-containing protein
MKCTDLLIQDHKTILRALDVLDEMAKRVDKEETVEREDVECILRFLRVFADDHHQAKEECALFPELRRVSSPEESSVRRMLFEHDQERSLVEALEEALHTRNRNEFVLFANRFGALIRNHIDKEDHILFEIVDRILSAEQDDIVVAEFDKFQVSPGLLDDLHCLESKYVQKAA